MRYLIEAVYKLCKKLFDLLGLNVLTAHAQDHVRNLTISVFDECDLRSNVWNIKHNISLRNQLFFSITVRLAKELVTIPGYVQGAKRSLILADVIVIDFR